MRREVSPTAGVAERVPAERTLAERKVRETNALESGRSSQRTLSWRVVPVCPTLTGGRGRGLGGGECGGVDQALLKVPQEAHEEAALEASGLVDHVAHHAHPGLQAPCVQACEPL